MIERLRLELLRGSLAHAAAALCCSTIVFTATLASAAPELQYLFPASATIGRETEVRLVGKQAETVTQLYFSQSGIKARILEKGRAAIRVAADAQAGECDVWAASDTGLSAPVRLAIVKAPVQVEAEPNNTSDKAQTIEIPAVVCGTIEPGTDGDWFRVSLAAEERLTMAARSTTLGGTVWPTITVLDAVGREVAHDSLTRLEPTVYFVAPQAGDYSICVQDRSYRATSSPFYQLTLSGSPPMAAPAPIALGPEGENAARGCRGWTLSRTLFTDTSLEISDDLGYGLRLEHATRVVRRIDSKMNKTSLRAWSLEIPDDVATRFTGPRDVVHWYRFAAKAGRTYWLEAVSERIDRPCDLELVIHDATGKPLETIGNIVTPKEGPASVPLDSRDPAGSWKAPADGDYLLAVRDLLAAPDHAADRAYRLSIGPRLEDVRVTALVGEPAAPRGWSVSPGGKLTVSLAAVRRGGHEAPITVRAVNLPPGLQVAPTTIAAKQSSGNFVIETTRDAPMYLGPIQLMFATETNGKPLERNIVAVVGLPGTVPAMSRICDQPVVAVPAK